MGDRSHQDVAGQTVTALPTHPPTHPPTLRSNGKLDPWISGGIVNNITGAPSLIALIIEEGAHHADLRYPESGEAPSVTTARFVERDAIQGWVNEFYAKRGMPPLELPPAPTPRPATTFAAAASSGKSAAA